MLTLKNIPNEVYERLKLSAVAHRRSMNSEAIVVSRWRSMSRTVHCEGQPHVTQEAAGASLLEPHARQDQVY